MSKSANPHQSHSVSLVRHMTSPSVIPGVLDGKHNVGAIDWRGGLIAFGAQFLVAKETLAAVPKDRIERLLQIVDGRIPDLCERIGPTYEKYQGQRLAYCYSLEFMWHVILGGEAEVRGGGGERGSGGRAQSGRYSSTARGSPSSATRREATCPQ